MTSLPVSLSERWLQGWRDGCVGITRRYFAAEADPKFRAAYLAGHRAGVTDRTAAARAAQGFNRPLGPRTGETA